MDKYQSIEERLHRLIPATLSDEAQADIDRQIDQLAGVEVTDSTHGRVMNRGMIIKAAATIALVVTPFLVMKSKPHVLSLSSGFSQKDSNLVVINSTNIMENMVEDGLIYPDDGSAPYFLYRFKISNENQLRDQQTGTVITVSQPSYEVVTIPQTVF